MSKNWLDGAIGWDSEFNTIVTCFPDDPAIDEEKSDVDAFIEDNFNMEHLEFKSGEEPISVEVSLPTPAQWSSIVPLIRESEGDAEDMLTIAAHKIFELCVRIPNMDSMKPKHRQGFKRLPKKAMEYFAKDKPHYITFFGSWIMNKYLLSEEEKKAS